MPISPVRGVKRATNVVSIPIVRRGEEQADDAAGERQQRAFREQLTNEAAAAGAERGANGELAVAPQHAARASGWRRSRRR